MKHTIFSTKTSRGREHYSAPTLCTCSVSIEQGFLLSANENCVNNNYGDANLGELNDNLGELE